MNILQDYNSKKQTEALLRIFERGFPNNQEVPDSLQELISKKRSWIVKLKERWINKLGLSCAKLRLIFASLLRLS